MSTDVTTTTPSSMALYSREKIDLIKQTVAKGATDLELQLFFHACQRTGLDPLMKQLYAIKRWSAADRRETLTFQTGIDGYRLIADRTGKYAGSSDPQYELNEEGFPAVATVTVHKILDNGATGSFTASARWAEYVQRTKDGHPNSMWTKMPFLMLGKCAEALALRKAFPAELSGVYTHEEMMQADQPLSQTHCSAKAKIAELMVEGLPPESPASDNHETAASPPSNDHDSGPPPLVLFRDLLDKLALCQGVKEWADLQNQREAAYEAGQLTPEQNAELKARAEQVKKGLGKK